MGNIVNKFFKKPLNPVQEEARIRRPAAGEGADETIVYLPPQLVAGSAQSVGKLRDHNEDALFAMTSVIAEGDRQLPFGIFIVADGMGGHQHGEVASGMATRALVEYLVARLYPPLMGLRAVEQEESLHEVIEMGIEEAQKNVLRKAPGGGTTLTVAVVIGNQVTLAHVGDSRAYFIEPDAKVELLTKDHSLVGRLVELGQITEEEAAVHPQRNVLYRALGQLEPIKPDINTHVFPDNGYLLLCSDGLWGVVPQEEIVEVVLSAGNLSRACSRLVEAANRAGGPDNISVVLVRYL
ncbi:MAG: serine/threonine-protein phosphatase [Anaerolineae bacterium]|nr:serine/threonine-protein phosphatase [Anaerolineae bacterium]